MPANNRSFADWELRIPSRADSPPSGTPHSALRAPPSLQPSTRGRGSSSGFTLVELLVVVVIALSITAIAIPLLVPSQDERRLLESSRLVTTGLAAARSRAIETRRPAGLVLERAVGQPEACFQLSFAEVPAPWAGGYVDSRIQIGEVWIADTDGSGTPDAGTEFEDGDGDGALDWGGEIFSDVDENGNTFYARQCGIVLRITDTQGNVDTSWSGLIKRRDLLRVNFQGHDYTIWTDASNLDANGHITSLGNSSTTCWRLLSDYSPRPLTPTIGQQWPPMTPPTQNLNGDTDPPYEVGEVGGLPFQIIRQPARSSLTPIQLPISVAIDLASSGFDNTLLNTLAGDLTILFGPGGAIQRVQQGGNSAALIPSSPIYLLVGKRQFIPSNPAPQAGEPAYNFQDLQARWIGINPATGMVASAPPAAADLTATVDANTWSTRLYESRQYIREGKTIGDK